MGAVEDEDAWLQDTDTDDSGDAALPGENELLYGAHSSDSSDLSEDERAYRAKRRRKAASTDALGLELVRHAALHPTSLRAGAPPEEAARIDGSVDAEASLLAMEVEGLLRHARPDTAAEGGLLALLQRVAALLLVQPTVEVAAGRLVRGLLADLGFRPVSPFTFRAPTRVQVVGSFALRAAVGPEPCVDLALLIPPACFDNKDELNHRYLAKRALYLSHLAAVLRRHSRELGEVAWESLADDPRRPALVLTPHPGVSPAGFRIRLLLCAPLELCSLARLGPERNSLRAAVLPPPPPPPPPVPAPPRAPPKGLSKQQLNLWKLKQKKLRKRLAHEAAVKRKQKPPPPPKPQLLPTPQYNTTVLQEMMMLPLADQCRKAAAGCQYFSDAVAMLRAWARQHQLSQGADGLNGTLLTLLLVHLLETGQASTHMDAMHLFRTVLVTLASPTALTTGLFMQRRVLDGTRSVAAATAPLPTSKAWRRAFEVVFVDPSGWLNLAAPLSKSALALARDCAARSLDLLNTGTPEAFDAVLLTRRHQAALCDYWFHVRLPPPERVEDGTGIAGLGSGTRELLRDQPTWRAQEQQVEALAAKALGTRARVVRAFRRTLHGSSIKSPLKQGALRPDQEHILLGVQVDPTSALRTLDMGPPADKADAAKAFRAFWGNKAELRRFQDGAITEAVVWEDGGAAERHLIVDSIMVHIAQRHLPAGTIVSCHAGAMDAALRRKHSTLDVDVQVVRLCEAAAERLGKQLRSLNSDSLPLRIVAVQPLSPVLRHTAAFPPLPHLLAGAPRETLASDHVARCLEPVELLCQLEGSGKWPDSAKAFLKMKAAVGCQLATLMHQVLGLDAVAAEEFVDVLRDGFAFRLRLATERDAAMQEQALQLGGEARAPVEEDMPLRTWHQGAISGVAGQNPVFEPTARLAKRWVGAHLLSPHLQEEAVELLLAHVFTAPTAPPPGSRLSGLLRFLTLLAEHPWRVQPLIVDPAGELSGAQREALLRQHAAQRAACSTVPMCLATPKDPTGDAWTSGPCPSSQVLHRIVVLAQRSAAALDQLLLGSRVRRPAGSEGGKKGRAVAARKTAAPSPPAALDIAAMLAALNGPASSDGSGGSGVAVAEAIVAPDPATPDPAEAVLAERVAATEAALASVFGRDLGEYDALVRLRTEGLPNAGNDLRLAGDASGASQRPALGPTLRAANQQLAALAAAASAAPSAKRSYAILKGIPRTIVQTKGHHLVRRELLVGFNPLPPFTQLLQQRLGNLAVCCTDYVGGSVVAIKWCPMAFVPAPLRPEAAHLVCPAGSPEAAASAELAARWKGGAAAAAAAADGLSAAVVVPDLVAIGADILALAPGLVESVQLQ